MSKIDQLCALLPPSILRESGVFSSSGPGMQATVPFSGNNLLDNVILFWNFLYFKQNQIHSIIIVYLYITQSYYLVSRSSRLNLVEMDLYFDFTNHNGWQFWTNLTRSPYCKSYTLSVETDTVHFLPAHYYYPP